MKSALALAVVLAVLGTWVLILLLSPATPNTTPMEWVSSRQCMECHSGVAEEWQESHHAFAYENPEVRALSQEFQNEECLSCHAPRPVLAFAPGERVLARETERSLGVDCLACHLLPSGQVATANSRPATAAPCRPVFSSRTRSVDTCAACHNQHGTVDQWRAAPEKHRGQTLRGQDCLHCHMTESPRAGGRMGKHHGFPAAHDLAMLQMAVELTTQGTPQGVHLAVENVGAAHAFPTDERSRAADLQIRFRGVAEVWGMWQAVHRFRDPYRDEVNIPNTQLPATALWETTVPWPSNTGSAEVRLLYRTQPFQSDEKAAELVRKLVTVP